LPSSGSRSRAAIARAIAVASVSASSVITSVAANRLRTVSIDRSGIESVGSAEGSGGTERSAGDSGHAA
jgi:hypothetical protein